MRRMICFLLILAFCVSLACPAFAAKTTPSPGEDGPAKRPSSWRDNPKTGDVILFWVMVMVVSVVALGAVYLIYRRKFCN